MNTINTATFRNGGGPIPNTVEFKLGQFTDNGFIEVLAPLEGEVWQVMYPLAALTSGSATGSLNYNLWILDQAYNDANGLTTNKFRIFFSGSSSNAPILPEDNTNGLFNNFKIGYNQSLFAEISSFSGTRVDFGVAAVRIT